MRSGGDNEAVNRQKAAELAYEFSKKMGLLREKESKKESVGRHHKGPSHQQIETTVTKIRRAVEEGTTGIAKILEQSSNGDIAEKLAVMVGVIKQIKDDRVALPDVIPSEVDEIYLSILKECCKEKAAIRQTNKYKEYYNLYFEYVALFFNGEDSPLLRPQSRDLLKAINAAKKEATLEELADYAELLMRAKLGIMDPDNLSNSSEFSVLAQKVQGQRSWGKIIGGIAMMMVGAVIMYGVYQLAILSFGATTVAPIHFLGIIFQKIASAELASITGGIFGLGIGAVGGFFAYDGRQKDVAAPALSLHNSLSRQRVPT